MRLLMTAPTQRHEILFSVGFGMKLRADQLKQFSWANVMNSHARAFPRKLFAARLAGIVIPLLDAPLQKRPCCREIKSIVIRSREKCSEPLCRMKQLETSAVTEATSFSEFIRSPQRDLATLQTWHCNSFGLRWNITSRLPTLIDARTSPRAKLIFLFPWTKALTTNRTRYRDKK